MQSTSHNAPLRTDTCFRLSLRPLLAATAVLVFFGFDTRVAHSQSLGDVARREAERRQEVAQPGRVYTNEDLIPVDSSPMPSEAGPNGSEPAVQEPRSSATPADKGPTVMEEDPETHKVNIRTTAPAREKRDEQYWRARAKGLRDQLANATSDLAAAQSSLEALTRGPQTPAAARERSVVAEAVQRLQSEVRYRQQDIAKMQTHAEMNKVPAEWIQ